MQSPGRSTSHQLPVSCFTIALTLILLPILFGSSGFAQQLPESEVYHRALVIGTSEAVRRQVADQPKGYQMSALLSHYALAELGKPPPPSGLQLARHFRRELRKTFGVVALGTCEESQLQVDCPSEYLGEEKSLFLRLKYIYKSTEEMSLELSAYQRGPTGEAIRVQIPRTQKLSFAVLWDDLSEIASDSQTNQ